MIMLLNKQKITEQCNSLDLKTLALSKLLALVCISLKINIRGDLTFVNSHSKDVVCQVTTKVGQSCFCRRRLAKTEERVIVTERMRAVACGLCRGLGGPRFQSEADVPRVMFL